MFNSKTKKETTPVSSGSNNTSLIGSGTIFSGDIEASGDLRIDGTVRGNILSKAKIVIGPSGRVEGDIEGAQADVMGTVTGSVKVLELLHLRADSVIEGNISARQLQVEPSARFNGQCHMQPEPEKAPRDVKDKEKKMPALSMG